MPLTDTAIRNEKPRSKDFTLYDAKGLYLLVKPNASRLWRLKYKLYGKPKLMSLGAYPAVSLAAARKKREDTMALIASGNDPIAHRQVERKADDDTFEAIARE